MPVNNQLMIKVAFGKIITCLFCVCLYVDSFFLKDLDIIVQHSLIRRGKVYIGARGARKITSNPDRVLGRLKYNR